MLQVRPTLFADFPGVCPVRGRSYELCQTFARSLAERETLFAPIGPHGKTLDANRRRLGQPEMLPTRVARSEPAPAATVHHLTEDRLSKARDGHR